MAKPYARAMAEKIVKGVLRAYNHGGPGDLEPAFAAAGLLVFEIIADTKKVVESELADVFDSVGAIEVEDA